MLVLQQKLTRPKTTPSHHNEFAKIKAPQGQKILLWGTQFGKHDIWTLYPPWNGYGPKLWAWLEDGVSRKVCSVVCANCPMDLALGAKIKLVHHALKITPEGVTWTSSRVVCVISLRASSLHLLTNIQGWLTALSMLGAWQPYILCLPHSAQPSLIPSVCGKAPCA